MHALLFISVDSNLGRCGRASLSQQTLLELFIEGLECKERFQDEDSTFLPVEKWRGLHFDRSNQVNRIEWPWSSLQGSVLVEWIPESVECLRIGHNKLCGSVHFNLLPPVLRMASMSTNEFSGSADFTCLPHAMRTLYIAVNHFSGSVDLTHLPDKLQSFDLSHNEFSGTISLSKIPGAMFNLDLRANAFVGEIWLSRSIEKVVFIASTPNLLVKFL